MDLNDIQTTNAPKPPRVVVYGSGGVGKTTFAANFPAPLFLSLEDGLGNLQVPFLEPKTYDDVIDVIKSLLTEEHEFKTLVLDSVDRFETLVWNKTIDVANSESNSNMTHIDEFGYGKGYQRADTYWLEFLRGLDALRKAGIIPVLIAHASATKVEDPSTGPYTSWGIKCHKRASDFIVEWSDITGFACLERTASRKESGLNKIDTSATTGRRLLILEDNGATKAKNRYGLPPKLPLDAAGFLNELSNKIPNNN